MKHYKNSTLESGTRNLCKTEQKQLSKYSQQLHTTHQGELHGRTDEGISQKLYLRTETQ